MEFLIVRAILPRYAHIPQSMQFTFESRVRAPLALLDAWHHRPGALARLTPPADGIRVIEAPGGIANGSRATLSVPVLPGIRVAWTAEHRDVRPGEGFTDVQLEGPFAEWIHTHRFLPDPDNPSGSLLRDEIVCSPHGGRAGALLAGPILRRRLNRLFAWRHARTIADVELLHRQPPARARHILVAGASGMIGRALIPYLLQAGHRVTTLSRQPAGPDSRTWDPAAGRIDLAGLDPIDAVIHLAGENVASGRWTQARRNRILSSRVDGTRLLAETLAAMTPRPAAMICASGISGYAADGRPQDEASPTDTSGFLGEVVQAWEAAADPARAAGIRVVHCRLGVVLGADGGALGKLAPVFRLGLGGPVGNGQAGFPWIAIDDVIELFHRAVDDPAYAGVINAVAPNPITNGAFTRALASVLHRPAMLPLPRAAVLLLFGQMGKETLMADHVVMSRRLDSLGFSFRFPVIQDALAYLLLRLPSLPSR